MPSSSTTRPPMTRKSQSRQSVTNSKQKKVRRAFSVETKVRILDYLKEHSTHTTADKFDIDTRSLRRWKLVENQLREQAASEWTKDKKKIHPGPDMEARILSKLSSMNSKGVLIDMFGTLIDCHSAVKRVFTSIASTRRITGIKWSVVVDHWLALIEDRIAKIRIGSSPFLSLDEIHRETLKSVLLTFNMTLSLDEIDRLVRAWEKAQFFESDTKQGLEQLRKKRMVACVGNANIALAVRASRILGISWDAVLGAEMVHQYLPDAQVFYKAADALGISLDACTFVSTNVYAIRTAKQLSMKTCFIHRRNTQPHLDMRDIEAYSDWIVSTFAEAITSIQRSKKASINIIPSISIDPIDYDETELVGDPSFIPEDFDDVHPGLEESEWVL